MRNIRIAALCALFASLPVTARDVLIRTREGITLSATLELPASKEARVPAILVFDIYAEPENHAALAKSFADRGYAGIVADARGKRLSPEAPAPYETEAKDASAVVEWIAKQPWSNGKVGMIGSSYSGFTAWAAAKYRPRALKGIAVSAPSIPGRGLPMHNGIFLTANYQWPFHVTNNKLLDHEINNDYARWNKMAREWFFSGRPFREIDAVDGLPNPWLQRWLAHPDYDAYWQSMVPYGKEFSRIGMPVLTITGYYDDAQYTSLLYLKDHLKFRRGAEHYLVVGPYDHAGSHASKKPVKLRDYDIDPAAQFDSHELKLQFMDYVLKARPKPDFLKDRINYEVMGANEWKHAPSLAAMHAAPRRFWFSSIKTDDRWQLTVTEPQAIAAVTQTIDLANRNLFHNFHYYPFPIVQGPLQFITEEIFATPPFETATTISGAFAGELHVAINKQDFDYGVTIYEAMPDGKLFHLGYSLNRASYATDPTRRKLLTPGAIATVPFETQLMSRRMQAGSRLLVLLDVFKNPYGQVNYGTGKDVSDESIEDAGAPLEVHWMTGSYVDVPVE